MKYDALEAKGDVSIRKTVVAIALALLLTSILILAAYYQLGSQISATRSC
jgi:hypothetical protein